MTEGYPTPAERRWYAVAWDGDDRGLAEQICRAVLDAVRPGAERVWIDAYSDYRDALPEQARAAQDELRARGELRGRRGVLRRRGDPGMAVELDPAQQPDWDLLRAYAAWSIHVQLDGAGGPLAVLHDCGRSVSADLSPAEADQLTRSLAGTARLEALDRRGP